MKRREFISLTALSALSGTRLPAVESTRNADDGALASIKDKLSRDPLRPQYHLLPQAGFVGDPCAPRAPPQLLELALRRVERHDAPAPA